MAKDATERPDPTQIGDVSAPPFVVLPDPATIFARRAERLRSLAQGHRLALYLSFVADLSEAQHKALAGLPDIAPLSADDLARAREFAMSPLDRSHFESCVAFDGTLGRFFEAMGSIPMPSSACEALQRVATADATRRLQFAHNVLADAFPVDMLAEHMFVAAALQIHFARLAQRLDAAIARSGWRWRLSGLRRRPERLHGGGLAWIAWRAFLRLLFMPNAMELCAHTLRRLRLHEGDFLSRDRGRRRRGQGRML